MEDRLDIIAESIRMNDTNGLEDACTLLCRMFTASSHLEIAAIQFPILDELQTIFRTARNAGRPTPVLPRTVMEVWEFNGEESELWRCLLEELCVAFSSKPMAAFAEYRECFRTIGPFRKAVGKAMADKIYSICYDGRD